MEPISEFETKFLPKLLNNAESWLGINDSHIKKLQNFQDNSFRKVIQVSASGTPQGHSHAGWPDALNEMENYRNKTKNNRKKYGKGQR